MRWYEEMNKKIPQVIAIYLPQFHETEDNNKWWGKGFTDWETVKTAERYFEGHDAPWIPYQNNYYDLNTYETMACQASLAAKYGIDGFCFYHYYFEKGKMELEKPAENLLKWKNINMPFCFNWASESWIRSWSRIDGNVWSEKFEIEKESDDELKGVLINQEYGDEEAWRKHFEYLLPFFLDERYIRIEDKPVFIFYRPNDIKCLNKMVSCWRNWAAEAGIAGLYLIGANTNIIGLDLDASMIYEPRTAINRINDKGHIVIKNGVRCFEYSDVWNAIIDERPYLGCKTFYSGVVGYDDTPRRGRSGECLINRSPKIFENGLVQMMKKSIEQKSELFFLNAWNEWGEGMYLEPDIAYKFEYLESVKRAKIRIEACTDIVTEEKQECNNEELVRLNLEVKKYKAFTEIFDKWLEAEREGKIDFKSYFHKFHIESIAIYGMAMMGKQTYQQLIKENVIPNFGIDRYVGQYGKEFKIIRPEDEIPKVDAIIVTTYDSESIVSALKEKTNSKILLLEELIDSFWRNE